MRQVKVTCDGCGADLTTTSNSVDWRLELVNDPIPCRPGPVTDMWIGSPIRHDCYFCNARCLRDWVEENVPQTPMRPSQRGQN